MGIDLMEEITEGQQIERRLIIGGMPTARQ